MSLFHVVRQSIKSSVLLTRPEGFEGGSAKEEA